MCIRDRLVARSVLDCLDMPPRRQSTLALAPVHADPELADDDQPRLPGHGRVWGKYVCRNKDQSSSSRYPYVLSLIHISEPTRLLSISYAVFCLKKKKKIYHNITSVKSLLASY
eukprot:TRINITY_DN16439_c0_g1_i3.p2 TRINITY_DN16439_c0_g1~~TRINITY_DN16439_c0_g1_i3.p2  ORF type:complete len:114 (+),score=24.65 TRINITY_DN16439_c0_g1_i3:124-465(+)